MNKQNGRQVGFCCVQQQFTTSLTTTQWQGIEKLISVKRRSVWPLQVIVEAIFYVTKNGIVWRDLPGGFPPWQTTYWYFRKWATDDTWLLIANELTMLARLKCEKDPLPTVAVVDSQSVKNSATATEQVGFDGGKLIKGRKRVVAVDTMGHVLWNTVQAANLHDGKAGVLLWEQAQALNPLTERVGRVHADGTFGGHFKEELENVHGLEVIITSAPIEHQPAEEKLVIHKWRWIVAAAARSARLPGWATTGAYPGITNERRCQRKPSFGLPTSDEP